MKCPFCSSNTHVYNSRSSHASTQTWRRRKCRSCNKTFTTREKVDFTGVVKVRTTEAETPYAREHLLVSIARACNHLNLPATMLSELTDSIELELKARGFFLHSPQEPEVIIFSASKVLSRYDKNLAVQYINQVYDSKPPLELLRQLLK